MACVYRKRALILAYQRPFFVCIGLSRPRTATELSRPHAAIELSHLRAAFAKIPVQIYYSKFSASEFSALKYSAWKYTVLQCPIWKYPA